MAKYDPLTELLRHERADEIVLTFDDIERVLRARLPPSACLPQWWATTGNRDTEHVQRRAWREAGFDAYLIKGASRVRFIRVR